MVIGINCGHTLSGTTGSGAVGLLNESNETRAVGYSLINKLRAAGNTVVDCTDDNASTVSENLRRICQIANAQPLDMFLSIHFNSGGGNGCEAYTFSGRDTAGAGEILRSVSSLGFKNRGIKDGSGLYVVRNTNAPAVLLEVCFVDSTADAELYGRLGADRIADLISTAIIGEEERGDDVMIYNYIDENMPEWARPTIQKLVEKGFLVGGESGLNLTEEMLRIFVVNDRAGLYD